MDLPGYIQMAIVAATIGVVFLAFLREWGTPDLIAVTGMSVLIITGILSSDDVLMVFSNHAPITIAAMFVLSAALERTGVIASMGRLFAKMAGTGEVRVLLAMMLMVAALSAFINNTPVVVIFMPLVLGLARTTGLKASRLLMPLSFAAMLGGTCTMIGSSTNLIVDGMSREQGVAPFGMFELAKLGLIYAVVGLIYLLTIGRKLLPKRETLSTLIDPHERKEFLTQAVIAKDSPLVGKTLTEAPKSAFQGVRILEVRRRGRSLETPLNEIVFEAGDRLRLKSVTGGLQQIIQAKGIDLSQREALGLTDLETEPSILMEGALGPRSRIVGKTVRQLNFRQKYGALILAIHRQGVNLNENFENLRLAFGDSLLVEGPAAGIRRLMEERDFVSLTEPRKRALRLRKAPIAVGAVVGAVALTSAGVLPIALAALLACVLVVLCRCIDPEEAYRAVDWKVIFLIFGMLAIGIGVEKSGLAAWAAELVTDRCGSLGPVIMISLIYLLTATLTELITNNAAAALLVPLVLALAESMMIDPRPFLVAVMFGASACFATPIGYQTNTYVYGAGGYRFADFPKVGLPLNLILWIVASICIPLMWPVSPAN